MDQSVMLDRERMNELRRCDRSFIMYLYHRGLTNDSLSAHGGVAPDMSQIKQSVRDQFLMSSKMKPYVYNGYSTITIDGADDDPYVRVDNTERALKSKHPAIIQDGALESNDVIAKAPIIVSHGNGMIDVYYQSTKSASTGTVKSRREFIVSAIDDSLPLIYVLLTRYVKRLGEYCAFTMRKDYVTPYPDPITHIVSINPDEFTVCEPIDIFSTDAEAKVDELRKRSDELQNVIAKNPLWIPSASMGTKCNKTKKYGDYECPFKAYCTMCIEKNEPESIRLHLGSRDVKNLETCGINDMADVVNLMRSNRSMRGIEKNNGKTFDLSEDGLYRTIDYAKRNGMLI